MMKYFTLLILVFCTAAVFNQEKIMTDADYTFDEALEGSSVPYNIRENLRLISVTYYSFDRKLHKGQLIVHKDLVKDIEEIFKFIRSEKFPVAKVIPIVKYHWSDEASMRDNNTSAFNYRFIKGKDKLSNHSTGRAIDINPWLNPHITNGVSYPEGATYSPKVPGSLSVNNPVVKEFKKKGWKWGGTWQESKDYQHFEKL